MAIIKSCIFLSILIAFCSSDHITAPKHIEHFGDCDEGSFIGNKIVFAGRNPFKASRETIVFPHIGAKREYIITGVKHIDYQKIPSDLTFRRGEIGSNRIEITVNSLPGSGIWSVVHFYGKILNPDFRRNSTQ